MSLIKPPKSLVSRTIAAAWISWLIGIPSLFLTDLLLSAYQNQFLTLDDPPDQFLVMGIFMAYVVFPTCVGIGLPLFMLLPRTSLLWRPFFATILGVILGPVAMLLIFAVLGHGSDRIDLEWTFSQAMIVTSAIVGGSFAYVSAGLNRLTT